VLAAAAGQAVLEGQVQRRLVSAVSNTAQYAQPTGTTAAPDGLTSREIDVLRRIAAGYSNAQIAEELYVSEATVIDP
jgi:DNA-binding NarL/FixJ family response regulator